MAWQPTKTPFEPQKGDLPDPDPGGPALTTEAPSAPGLKPEPTKGGFWGNIEDQLALRPLIREYLTPVEVNNIWYSLGGVLGISLFLEALTGIILAFWYRPDAAAAYGITKKMLETPVWSVIINFHYWNSFLIFGLVMVHMMRVFLSGGY